MLLKKIVLSLLLTSVVFGDPIIKKIEFKGLKTLVQNAQHFKLQLTSREGGVFSKINIRKDIETLYTQKLFNDIVVDCKTIRNQVCTENASAVILTYILKENPAIKEVIVQGDNEVDREDIDGVINVQPNTVLNIALIQDNTQKIIDLYRGKGLFLADVSFKLKPLDNNMVTVVFDIKENAKTIIRNIRFIGNEHLSAGEIKRVMLTKEGGLFSSLSDTGIFKAEDFERDLAVIKMFYREKGYLKAQVAEPELRLSQDKKEMNITIYVSEGKQYSFGTFTVGGDLLYKKEKLLAPFLPLQGKKFKQSEIARAVQQLNNLYKNKGYADVTISTPLQINEENRIINIPLMIQKGEKAYIERIEFLGNTTTRDKVIRRELRIYEGDLYSYARLEYSRARVFSTGYFEVVEFSEKEGSRSGRKVIVFKVKEKGTGSFQAGLGFSTIEKLVFNANIVINNVFGNGQNVSLSAQVSELQRFFSLSFSDPYFLDTLWDTTYRIYNTNMIYSYFTKETIGGSIRIGHPITDFLRAYISLKAENVTVEKGGRLADSSDLPPVYGLFKDGRTVSLEGTLIYDRRDNRLFPTKGFYQSLSIEHADYLSENKFTKLSSDTRIYIPLFWRFIYRMNIRAGWIPDSQNVPIFERYYVGGIFTVRGFEWGTLSPSKDQITSPYSGTSSFQIGGNKQLIINNEIEFDIIQSARIKGVFFIDAGNAFIEEDPISITNLRASWGFGFRWISPMAPLRFEWGFPFNPKEDERNYLFEFNIGTSF